MNMYIDLFQHIALFLDINELRNWGNVSRSQLLTNRVWKNLVKNKWHAIYGVIMRTSFNINDWNMKAKNILNGFSFRLDIFDREHGSSIFRLSAYAADVRYQKKGYFASYEADSRYGVIEAAIPGNRLRPSVSVNSHLISDILVETFEVGEFVEVQWRYNRSWPFGWWLGVVNSIEEGKIIIDFMSYAQKSRWRQTTAKIDNERFVEVFDGCSTGAVRKLTDKEQIEGQLRQSKWLYDNLFLAGK